MADGQANNNVEILDGKRGCGDKIGLFLFLKGDSFSRAANHLPLCFRGRVINPMTEFEGIVETRVSKYDWKLTNRKSIQSDSQPR